MLNPKPIRLKIDRYKKKAKNQKITAWSMLGGGVLLIAIGAAINDEDANAYYSVDQYGNVIDDPTSSTSTNVVAVGLLSMVGSVPFFISSGVNKRKARAFVGTTFYPNPLSPAHNRIMPSAGIQFNIR